MQKIYVFGDSIAQGVIVNGEGRFQLSRRGSAELLQEAGYPIINYAMDGYTIRQGLASFRKKRLKPGALCVIEFGANDCELNWDAISADPGHFYDGRTPHDEFPGEVDRFILEARERGMEPVLMTPPPLMSCRYYRWICRGRNAENLLRYFHGDPEGLSRWEERYVSVLREKARQHGCRLLDLRDWMVREGDYPDFMCMDGSHPNEAGHAVIARRVMERYPLAPENA